MVNLRMSHGKCMPYASLQIKASVGKKKDPSNLKSHALGIKKGKL